MSATVRPEAPPVAYDGPVVAVRGVDLDREGQEVLRDINFVLEKGQILGVVGPNGGGKTSLLRLVLGLERPTRGFIDLFGQPVARFRGWNRIGYIPQHAVGFDQNFPASVREIVLLGRVPRRGLFRWLGTEDRDAARRAIELCGLTGLEGRRVGALSGGEKQRVFIAKAIAAEPDLLVMDEPTAGVDPESERRFYDLLGRLKDELGLTVIFVSHDLGVVSARVDRVACLNRTLVYEGPPRALRDEELLRRLYGTGMVTIAHDQDQPHTHGH
jgi:zinc transport system ATP-binding protein